MRRALFPAIVLSAAVTFVACRTPLSDRYPPAKTRLMSAAQRVLARHFTVTAVDWSRGVVEARSVVGANLASKYRTVAIATVFRNGRGEYDCEIRVTNELEWSLPSLQGGAQPGYDWRAAGFDRPYEALLMAEVEAELGGPPVTASRPRRSHFMFLPPMPTTSPLRHRDIFRPRVPDLRPRPKAPAPKAPPPPPAAAPAPRPPIARKPAPPAPAMGALYQQYMTLGERYLSRREYGKALLEYQRAAFARPESAAAHLALAAVWAALDRYPAAAEALRQAADASGDHAPASAHLARLRGLNPDAAQRLLFLKGWVQKNPGDTDARLVLGYHCLLADRAEEARRNLQQVLKAKPGEAAARYLMRQL